MCPCLDRFGSVLAAWASWEVDFLETDGFLESFEENVGGLEGVGR